MMILYRCNLCKNEIKKVFSPTAKIAPFLTCHCSGVLEKQLPDFSTSSFETVDNGNMARKVELRKDAAMKSRQKGDVYIETMRKREKGFKKDED